MQPDESEQPVATAKPKKAVIPRDSDSDESSSDSDEDEQQPRQPAADNALSRAAADITQLWQRP